MRYIKKKNWVKNYKIDRVEKRLQLGFFRCLICREWIGIYRDEFSEDGTSFRGIRCSSSTCPFYDSITLEKW